MARGMVGNGIIATGTQRVATQQAPEDQMAGVQKAVLLEALARVLGAGGLESATAGQSKGDIQTILKRG